MTRHLTGLSVAVMLLTACGTSKGPATGATPEGAVATLRVDNQRFADMTIYVIESGVRQRLGLAPGNRVTSFTIPRRMSGAVLLRFSADPIGGRALPVTEDIIVESGDEVTMRITP